MLRKIIKNTKFAFSGFQKNPYTVLGLSPTASEEEIKSAYLKLAKQYHPDLQPQLVEKFKEVNEAYNILKDPSKVTQVLCSEVVVLTLTDILTTREQKQQPVFKLPSESVWKRPVLARPSKKRLLPTQRKPVPKEIPSVVLWVRPEQPFLESQYQDEKII